MGFDVKITTFFRPLELVAPLSCRGCGRLGGLLCGCCKNYNISWSFGACARCGGRILGTSRAVKGGSEGAKGLAEASTAVVKRCKCKVPVYTVGYREGVLKELVEEYKFNSLRAASEVLAELIDEVLPEEMGEVAIVPLPTVSRHIRERGFDHTRLLAKKLARRRKEFSVALVLKRKGQKVQVGKGEKERRAQAAEAYEADIGAIDAGKTYLLLDDVWTTGASMEAAIAVMKKAGARRLMAAVIEIPPK